MSAIGFDIGLYGAELQAIIASDKMVNYDKVVQGALSPKRYTHSKNVAEMCFKLAKIYSTDAKEAYMAGLLHDIRKEIPFSDMKKEVLSSKFVIDPVEGETQSLWHAIAGAKYVRDVLEIGNEDLILAIRYHTVGNKAMTTLQKIVYLSDITSADRNYKDVNKYRKLATQGLDKAVFESVKWLVSDIMEKGSKFPRYTIDCYNYYLDLQKKQGVKI